MCVLEEYRTAFKKYCFRQVYEVSIDTIMQSSSLGHQLCIKMDEIFSISLNNVDIIRNRIASILNIDVLVLTGINTGSMELTFRYFEKVDAIFPLNEEKKISLALIGVKWLQSGQCIPLVIEELRDFQPFFLQRQLKLHHEFISGTFIAAKMSSE